MKIELTAERPWLGLASYEEAHRPYFFGRRAEEEDLFERVRRHRLTVLYGPSGLGKTSLLQAGLCPRLREAGAGWLPVRVRLSYPERLETVVEAEPQALLVQVLEHLVAALAEAGHPTATKLRDAIAADEVPGLWELWHDTSWGLSEIDAPKPVLLLDQFEEIFTLGEDEARARAAAAILRDALADLIEDRPPPALDRRLSEEPELAARFDFSTDSARVVIILREDYLARLERWKKILPSLLRNRQELRLLDGPRALQAVTGPARVSSGDQGGIVGDGVGAAIIRAIADVSEDTALEEIEAVPPLLSLLCRELNERRLAAGLTAIDLTLVRENRSEILQRFYTECFTGFPAAVRDTIEDLLLSPGGYRENPGYDTLCEVLRQCGIADPKHILSLLVERRLITAEDRGGRRRVELTHDVLAPIVKRSVDERREREALARAKGQRRKIASIAAGMGILLAIFATLTIWAMGQQRLAKHAKGEIDQQLARTEESNQRLRAAEAEQDALLLKASRGDHEAALRSFVGGKHPEGLAYLNRALEYYPHNPAAKAARACFSIGPASTQWSMRSIAVFDDYVIDLVFSPDGRWLAVGSNDGTARIIDAASGKEVSLTKFEGRVSSVAFSPDGRWLAAGSGDNTARVINAASGKEISRISFEDEVISVAFSPDGRWLVAGSNDNTARVIDAASGREISRTVFENSVTSVAFSPDGRWLAAGSYDKTARVIDAASGKEVSLTVFENSVVFSVAFSADGRWLAAAGVKTAQVIDAASGREISRTVFEEEVRSLAFSPDGRWLAAGSNDNTARVIDAASGKEVSRIVFEDNVTSVAFSPDGRWFAAGSYDKTARIIDTASGKEVSRTQFEESVTSVAFSPDGRWLAAGSFDKTARIVGTVSGKEVSRTKFEESITSVAFSPDGRWLAAGSWDNTARVIDAASGKEVSRTAFDNRVMSVAFSPDGQWLAAGSWDNTARVIDAASGKEISRTTFEGDVSSVAFNLDGRRLVAAGVKNWRVVDAISGKEVSRTALEESVTSVAFSLDGRWLAAGSRDKSARVIDVASGKEVSRTEFEGSVTSVAFSPDGSLLAAGSWDKTARVIDAASGREVSRIVFEATVYTVAFSPDGRWLAAGSNDGTARIIDAASGKEVSRTKFEGRVSSVAFSPDGRWLAVGNHDRIARVIDARWLNVADESNDISSEHMAQFLSGQVFESGGLLRPLLPEEWRTIAKSLGTGAMARSGTNQQRILEWYLAEPERRTVSPWTSRLLLEKIGDDLLDASYTSKLASAADSAPWHPLVPIALARDENDNERRGFLAKLSLKRLADADEPLYGKATLANYGAHAAKWMLEMNLKEEALAAVEFALKKQSDYPLAKETKATIEEALKR